jgi:hypothetical protein
MVAGDTTIVMDGIYTEGMINFSHNGTAGNPITLRAQNKWHAILSSTSHCMPAIYVLANYITIDGLRFSVSPSNVPCGLATGNSWNAAVWCYNARGVLPTTTNPNTPAHHCVIQNNLVDESSDRDVGLKIIQDYAIIQNNVVRSSIEGYDAYGMIFRNNTVYHGDHWNSFIFAKGGVRNQQIYNNVVYMAAGQNSGINLGGSSDCLVRQDRTPSMYDITTCIEAYNSVAYNNVIVVSGGATATYTSAIGFGGAVNSAIFNNVVIGGQIFANLGSNTDSSVRSPVSNPTIKNNIFSCNGGAAFGVFDYINVFSLDYNDFYNCTGTPSQAHGLTANPLLVDSNADLHLQSGSPAIGAGAPVSFTGFRGEIIDVSKDVNGVPRKIPWSLGIYANASTALRTGPANK